MGGLFGLFGSGKKKPGGFRLDTSIPHEPPLRAAPSEEAVFGSDNRLPVPDVTEHLWRPLVCLQVRHANGVELVGTGLLIAPRLILTAAHNLFSLDQRQPIVSGIAQVGVSNDKPQAESRLEWFDVFPGYKQANPSDLSRYAVDFGLARVADDVLHKWAGYSIDVPSLRPMTDGEILGSKFSVAGYPLEKQSPPLVLKSCYGPVKPGTLSALNFGYEMDTLPGQSGGPVFRFDKATRTYYFGGVHVAGWEQQEANYCRRYEPGMRKQLLDWIASLG